MEIFTLLENLEELIENSKKMPFTNKIMIEQDEILDIIKDIRLKLPEDLKQAKCCLLYTSPSPRDRSL